MPFQSDLVVKAVGDQDWKLMSRLRYEGTSQCFEVPPGAETDFASVPVLFQWLIPRSGRAPAASVRTTADAAGQRALRRLVFLRSSSRTPPGCSGSLHRAACREQCLPPT